MASEYTGNPNATEVPSPAPGPGVIPKKSIPAGTDALSIESIAQDMKVDADFVGHIQSAVRLDTPVVSGDQGFTAVTYNGFGTGTLTPSNAKIASGLRVVVKIVTPGAAGVATYVISTDGGNTFSGTPQLTGTPAIDSTTGIWLTFGAGTFNADGTASFRSGCTPQAQWNNSAGDTRSLVDYLGFMTGGITVPVIDPLCGLKTSTTGSQSGQSWGGVLGWTMNCGVNVRSQWNGTIAGGELTAVWPCGAYELTLQAARTSSDTFSLSSPMFYNGTDNGSPSYILNQCSTVMEWAFAPQNTLAATDWYMGMTDSPASGSPITATQMKAGLRYSPGAKGDTHMMLVTSNGTSENATSTGVTPVASTIYRVRLEIHRSGTPLGACVRLFVDGALTSTTTDLPIANPLGTDMGFEFFGQSTGTGVRSGLEIGYFKRFTLPLGSLTANI